MPEVQCPNCRAMTSSEASFCASCGASLASVKAGGSPLPVPSMGATPTTSPLPSPVMSGGPAVASPPPAAPPQAPPAASPGFPPQQAPMPPQPGMPPQGAPGVPAAMAPPSAGMSPPPALANLFGQASPMSPQLENARRLGREAFVHRLLAFLIDGIMIAIVSNLLLVPLWWTFGPFGALLTWWIPAGLMAIYMMIMEGSGGQTVGKMLLSVRVVREDLGPVNMDNIKGRAIGILLYPLLIPAILDLIYCSGEGQTLGDRWGHTTVIRVQ